MSELRCTVEFTGGLELLFDRQKRLPLTLPAEPAEPFTVRRLLALLRDRHLRERPELFVQGEDIRPGILIVINEVDSELCGHLDYALQDGDCVLFISTLHGG